MAGGIVMVLMSLALSFVCFGIFISALIHCLKHKHDKDRLTWVIVIIFVPLIGGILYFTIGRGQANYSAVGYPHHPIGPTPTPPPDAMDDESKRAAAISQSLSAMSAARKIKK